MWVKQCHKISHPPVITIFIGGVVTIPKWVVDWHQGESLGRICVPSPGKAETETEVVWSMGSQKWWFNRENGWKWLVYRWYTVYTDENHGDFRNLSNCQRVSFSFSERYLWCGELEEHEFPSWCLGDMKKVATCGDMYGCPFRTGWLINTTPMKNQRVNDA